MSMSMSVIEQFLSMYTREYDFYREAARRCAEQCEVAAEQNGIRVIVTHRAKRPDRLREKLEKRNALNRYESSDSIREDIADLAGVRVALYFPGDREEMGRLIGRSFKAGQPKHFPERDAEQAPSYTKRFSGYWATHYRVSLLDEALSEGAKHYSRARIEIQVASVLMHAWAEVEHDLVYKPLTGRLSKQEYAALDELNGLVLSGEIALERLQETARERISNSGKKSFENHYELASFLYASVSTRMSTGKEPVIGRADLLFRFLRRANMNSPERLSPMLDKLKPMDEELSIVDQLIDSLLSTDFGLYGAYFVAKSELSEPSRTGLYNNNEKEQSSSQGDDRDRSKYFYTLGSIWVGIECSIRVIVHKQTVQEAIKFARDIERGSVLKTDDLRSIGGISDAETRTFENLKDLTVKDTREQIEKTADIRHLERLIRAGHGLLKFFSSKSSDETKVLIDKFVNICEQQMRNVKMLE